MSEMVYAVHTRACTYLLDDEGVCGWVLSPSGDRAEDRCIGAQFVACLDLREQGGLIGELRVGASGLFARRESGRYVLLKTSVIERVEYRRSSEMSVTVSLPDMVPVEVDPDEPPATQRPPPDQPPETQRLAHRAGRNPRDGYAGYEDGYAGYEGGYAQEDEQRWTRTEPPPPGYVGARSIEDPETGPVPDGYGAAARAEPQAIPADPELIDLEELSTFSSEVTLTIPLYRPDPDEAWGGYEEAQRGWPAGGRHRRG